jgi:hypothetical protein
MHAMFYIRLDISFSMGLVSKHLSNCRHNDWTYVKQLFKYLRRASTRGIFYGGLNNNLELVGGFFVPIGQEIWSLKNQNLDFASY